MEKFITRKNTILEKSAGHHRITGQGLVYPSEWRHLLEEVASDFWKIRAISKSNGMPSFLVYFCPFHEYLWGIYYIVGTMESFGNSENR